MKLHRFFKEDTVLLALDTRSNYGTDIDVPPAELSRIQEGVIGEFAGLFEGAGLVSNLKRLREDLLARERRTSTALGLGIAFPHVRTQQARGFALAVGRSSDGLPFAAADHKLVHLFVAMIAPPHDDKLFIKIEQQLATAFTRDGELYESLMAAETKGEIVRALTRLV